MKIKDIAYYTGRRVKGAYTEAGDVQCEVGRAGVESIVLSAEHYGDHGENWLICFGKDGKELCRYNTAKMGIIEWLPEVSGDE